MKNVVVTAGVLRHQNKYLCTQRAKSKLNYISEKYEFPGGKIELDETFEACIERELKEELDIDVEVDIKDYFMMVEHTYPDFKITMHVYLFDVDSIEINLKEHINSLWLPLDQLDSLDWAMADIPVVNKLRGVYGL